MKKEREGIADANETNEPPASTGRTAAKSMRVDARRNRERVLKAASRIFTDKGISVPMEEIASLAGVGVGTVYRHFPTKESLFEAVINVHKLQLAEEASSRLDYEDSGEAFFGFLSYMIHAAGVNQALADHLAGSGMAAECADEAATQRLHDAMAALLEKAKRAGAVRPDIGYTELLALISALMTARSRPYGDSVTPIRLLNIVSDGLLPRL